MVFSILRLPRESAYFVVKYAQLAKSLVSIRADRERDRSPIDIIQRAETTLPLFDRGGDFGGKRESEERKMDIRERICEM